MNIYEEKKIVFEFAESELKTLRKLLIAVNSSELEEDSEEDKLLSIMIDAVDNVD